MCNVGIFETYLYTEAYYMVGNMLYNENMLCTLLDMMNFARCGCEDGVEGTFIYPQTQ